MPRPATLEQLFSYHAPNRDTRQRYERIRAAALAFAQELDAVCPQGADLSAAIRLVREAMMTANASIAIGSATGAHLPWLIGKPPALEVAYGREDIHATRRELPPTLPASDDEVETAMSSLEDEARARASDVHPEDDRLLMAGGLRIRIEGKTGSGKSTLARLLADYIAHWSPAYHLLGCFERQGSEVRPSATADACLPLAALSQPPREIAIVVENGR